MRVPATASAAPAHGQRERLHPPVAATVVHQHQLLAAWVKRLDPEIPTQDDALRIPRLVERDAGHLSSTQNREYW
jgi:hypothetical protein